MNKKLYIELLEAGIERLRSEVSTISCKILELEKMFGVSSWVDNQEKDVYER